MRQLRLAGFFAAALTAAPQVDAQVFNGGVPAGYTCSSASAAACGTSNASGSVTLAPTGGSRFGFVSTSGGTSLNPLGIVNTTNGTTLTSSVFTSTAGQSLSFAFNYITSDGSGFSDYAFVRLLSNTGGAPLVLFTARTTVGTNTVPGFGLPGLAPGVTLSPPTTAIIPGEPTFSPGGVQGCFSTGCGFTGWINATFVVTTADTYRLQFGVFNFNDTYYESALAFDFTTGVGGTPVAPVTPTPGVVPEPSTYALFGTGLIGLLAYRRRRSA